MNVFVEVRQEIDYLINKALEEDLDKAGDLTSNLLLEKSKAGSATIIAKQNGKIAGLYVAEQVFKNVDKTLSVTTHIEDGCEIYSADEIMTVSGSISSILTAERTALNFLQRLSGIATLTAKFVKIVEGTHVKILDTRKTTPGLRKLEKCAVKLGGGHNHRMGLFDMILIKENHITGAGGIIPAVQKIKNKLQERNLKLQIELETKTLSEVQEALELNVDRIMLDNMSLQEIRKAVRMVQKRVELEVSGGVNLETVRELAKTGVDYISIGALTHSAPALDLSLLIEST